MEFGPTKVGRIKRQNFTEEQIIGVLREQEAGAKAADLCRNRGIWEATFHTWKAKHGGMEVSEAKRLKAPEEENAKLKKLLAEQMLDVAALRKLLQRSDGGAGQHGDTGGIGAGNTGSVSHFA
jgi:putative transposase